MVMADPPSIYASRLFRRLNPWSRPPAGAAAARRVQYGLLTPARAASATKVRQLVCIWSSHDTACAISEWLGRFSCRREAAVPGRPKRSQAHRVRQVTPFTECRELGKDRKNDTRQRFRGQIRLPGPSPRRLHMMDSGGPPKPEAAPTRHGIHGCFKMRRVGLAGP